MCSGLESNSSQGWDTVRKDLNLVRFLLLSVSLQGRFFLISLSQVRLFAIASSVERCNYKPQGPRR